jgi:predicted ATP-binding protein involved in virulence
LLFACALISSVHSPKVCHSRNQNSCRKSNQLSKEVKPFSMPN